MKKKIRVVDSPQFFPGTKMIILGNNTHLYRCKTCNKFLGAPINAGKNPNTKSMTHMACCPHCQADLMKKL